MVVKTANLTKPKKQKILRYTLDCTRCVEDKLLSINSFAEYLTARFKVNGKINNLGTNVVITASTNKVTVSSSLHYSKRYLKYLTKKYLKSMMLRDWIRVIASSNNVYELRYFNIVSDGEEDAQE